MKKHAVALRKHMVVSPLITHPRIIQFSTFFLLLSVLALFFFTSPVPQDPLYHHFADSRSLFGIVNFWNVVSNAGFLVVGLIGLYRLAVSKSLTVLAGMGVAYGVFFAGICLVAFGSAQYHLHPANLTLIWDRSPMTIAFMALLAICVAECGSPEWGRRCLWPLLVTGQFSVFYWYHGEVNHRGDLRPYALVQFVPLLLLPVLLLAGRKRFTKQWGYWCLFGCYAAGKVCEHFDAVIYIGTHEGISGHALKHIFIVTGVYALLKSYEKRKAVL